MNKFFDYKVFNQQINKPTKHNQAKASQKRSL